MTEQALLAGLLCHLLSQSSKDGHPEQVSRHCLALIGTGLQVSCRAVLLKFSVVRGQVLFPVHWGPVFQYIVQKSQQCQIAAVSKHLLLVSELTSMWFKNTLVQSTLQVTVWLVLTVSESVVVLWLTARRRITFRCDFNCLGVKFLAFEETLVAFSPPSLFLGENLIIKSFHSKRSKFIGLLWLQM